MAKKSPSPTTNKSEPEDKRTGIEKVIDFLTANKANIRGIVIGINAKPGKKIGDKDGSGDSCVLSVDMEGNKHSEMIRSVVTQGLANEIAQHCLPERRGFFG